MITFQCFEFLGKLCSIWWKRRNFLETKSSEEFFFWGKIPAASNKAIDFEEFQIEDYHWKKEEENHPANPLSYKLVVILNASNLYFTSIKGLNLLISFSSTLLQFQKKPELFLSNYQKSAKHNRGAHTHFVSSSS